MICATGQGKLAFQAKLVIVTHSATQQGAGKKKVKLEKLNVM